MITETNNILKAIPKWSKKLQSQEAFKYNRELGSAHNFVTDHSGKHWTYGKSVGKNGSYHRCGGRARIRLEELGFIDVLKPRYANTRIRHDIEKKFRNWAAKVKAKDFGEKLDRYLSGKLNVQFRLFVPPNY